MSKKAKAPNVEPLLFLRLDMNLWFRLIKLILTSWWGPRMDIKQAARMSFRVWPTDLDTNLHVNNGRYLSLMDLGRTDLMIRGGLVREVLQQKWMPVVASAHITYRRSLSPFQKFSLETRIMSWDDKWFYIVQIFHDEQKIYARGLVKAGLKSRSGMVATEKILAALGEASTPPELAETWKNLVKADQELVHEINQMTIGSSGEIRHQ